MQRSISQQRLFLIIYKTASPSIRQSACQLQQSCTLFGFIDWAISTIRLSRYPLWILFSGFEDVCMRPVCLVLSVDLLAVDGSFHLLFLPSLGRYLPSLRCPLGWQTWPESSRCLNRSAGITLDLTARLTHYSPGFVRLRQYIVVNSP